MAQISSLFSAILSFGLLTTAQGEGFSCGPSLLIILAPSCLCVLQQGGTWMKAWAVLTLVEQGQVSF